MPRSFQNATKCAEAIVDIVGREIRLAIPVGIGKPNLLVNALYALAQADRTLKLQIFTGLTLIRPRYAHELERRFAKPLLERLFGSYPDLAYAEAIRANDLPNNIEVQEFFLQAGAWLDSTLAQRNFVSLNYVDVARHLAELKVNVLAQLVAPQPGGKREQLSLSSNTDVALDMRGYVARQRRRGRPIALAAEFNDNLPFMLGEALRPASDFDLLLEPAQPHFELFAPPKMPVSLADYAAAIRVAALIKDGGTLQIGIGTFGDALSHALILRHTRNDVFRELVDRLGVPANMLAELEPFEQGLYGCSEMLVDGFLALRDAGILKRKVAKATGDASPALVHAAFFLGNRAFYQALRDLPEQARSEIGMTAVSFTNSLLGQEKVRRMQRRDARFVNSAMIATLLGSVTSDQLEDGRVVSGVGGQNDFVTMAHNMSGARSIIVLKSTRRRAGLTKSNIVWRFAHTSIPRQLRDILVTEYGVANLRGKSDRDVIVELLQLAHSDFQLRLQQAATKARKLERSFVLGDQFRDNRPRRIESALGDARRDGLLPRFPLGSEMTDEEQAIVVALDWLGAEGVGARASALIFGFAAGPISPMEARALKRMSLARPRTLQQHALRCVLIGAMRNQHG